MLGILALVYLLPNTVPGQNIGDRVRVTVAEGRVTGTISRINERKLIIATQKNTSSSIAIDEIKRLERSLGKRRNGGKGLIIGGVLGTVGGILLGTVVSLDEDDVIFFSGIFDGVHAGMVWGIIGSASGLVIGSLTKTEKWERVQIQFRNRRTLIGDHYLMLTLHLTCGVSNRQFRSCMAVRSAWSSWRWRHRTSRGRPHGSLSDH